MILQTTMCGPEEEQDEGHASPMHGFLVFLSSLGTMTWLCCDYSITVLWEQFPGILGS